MQGLLQHHGLERKHVPGTLIDRHFHRAVVAGAEHYCTGAVGPDLNVNPGQKTSWRVAPIRQVEQMPEMRGLMCIAYIRENRAT